jgi:transposase-like protein
MKNSRFKSIAESVEDLNRSQIAKLQKQLFEHLGELDSQQAFGDCSPKACPHCKSALFTRFGIQNSIQRYRCKSPDCGKTFCASTGTPLNHLAHKKLLGGYASCMAEGLTLRQTSKKMNITLDRAFRWRHRFLSMPVGHQPKAIAGVLEIDETFFRTSFKGSRSLPRPKHKRGGRIKRKGTASADFTPVMIGRARGQAFTLDKIMSDLSKEQVVGALQDCACPEKTMIYADSHKSHLQIPVITGVECVFFVESDDEEEFGDVHVQNVNNYHERLKTWLYSRLRGVATRYLPHYLAWQRLKTWSKEGLSPSLLLSSALGFQTINL